jgi:hypothetical protein
MRFACFPEADMAYVELVDRLSVEPEPTGLGLIAEFDDEGLPVGLTFEHWIALPPSLAGTPQVWEGAAMPHPHFGAPLSFHEMLWSGLQLFLSASHSSSRASKV